MIKNILFLSFLYIFLTGFIFTNTENPVWPPTYEDVPLNQVFRPVSEVLGITHVGGKYHFTNKPYLIEGADTIKYLGTKVIKLWFTRTGSSAMQDSYVYNSAWPTNIRTLKELAQTQYFRDVFNMPFKTFILEAMDVNALYWKSGMTQSKELAVKNEFYELTKYLLDTYKNTGKTFILQNWEGDNALNAEQIEPSKLHIAIDGMTKWCNARQEGVNKARKEIGSAGVIVAHCFEMNLVLPNTGDADTKIFVVDSIVPRTYCDLYSLSSWGTRMPGDESKLTEKLNYIAAKAPDSKLYGSKNIMLGEFGQYELSSWNANLPFNEQSGELQKISVENQIKYATEWGVPYLIYWQIYCNGLRANVTYNPGDNMQNNQLKGVWLIRADGTYTPTWRYFQYLFKNDSIVKTQRPIEEIIVTKNQVITQSNNSFMYKLINNNEEIDFDNEKLKIKKIMIFNTSGILVGNYTLGTSFIQINTLKKGLYILAAFDDKNEKIIDFFLKR